MLISVFFIYQLDVYVVSKAQESLTVTKMHGLASRTGVWTIEARGPTSDELSQRVAWKGVDPMP